MPGAGKSTIAEGLQSKGYDIINMGNTVREEAKKKKFGTHQNKSRKAYVRA